MIDAVVRRSDDSIEFEFSACVENIDHVCEEIRNSFPGGPAAGRSFPVQLLLREALNNAVLHGCRNDLSRKIKCSAKLVDNMRVALSVEDEGNGFDWRKCMNRSEWVDLACSGRGLRIMSLYSKKVQFNKKGNVVVLEIDLSPGGTCDEHNKK